MRRVLVVEDGNEYVEAFRRLAPVRDGRVKLVRAGDLLDARRALRSPGDFDAVFFDVVFDRTPPERLCGDAAALLSRFAGDASRVRAHLARQQGFYVAAELAAELAGRLPDGAPVVIAYDFTAEPGRLEALRERIPRLEGIDDGAPLSRVLARLAGEEA